MQNFYILIPVFNEAQNISILSNNLNNFLTMHAHPSVPNIIFINDGSTDATCEEIKKYFMHFNYRILTHDKNHGPGKAFSTGFTYLADKLQTDDWILTMEGDNTSSHAIIPKMFRRTEEGYSVILASPYMYGGTILNTTKLRKFLSFMSNMILKELLGLRGIATISSFFRLYKGEVIIQMYQLYGDRMIQSKGFEGVVEFLMKLVFVNTPISEIPLVLDTANRKGKSKMRIIKTSLHLLMLLRYKSAWKKQNADTA